MQQVFNLFHSRFFATLVMLTLLSACGGSGTESETPTPTPADITAPVITLNGESSITLYQGEVYSELGASAVDDKDGTIEVVVSGTVDTSTVGSYTLTYTATDNANNTSTTTRAVEVIPVPIPVISKIDVFSEPTEGGQLLRAYPTCDNCIAELYQYSWIIDGVSVSSVASYSLTYSDFNKKIQIEIQGSNEVNVTTSAYQIIEVQPSSLYSQVYSNGKDFAVLNNDGKLVTWGRNPQSIYAATSELTEELISDNKIYSNDEGFAGLKSDGTMTFWQASDYSGDSSAGADQLKKVNEIYSNNEAYVALKNDGTVFIWGDRPHSKYNEPDGELVNVTKIYVNDNAFAALKSDGTVVTWGHTTSGGDSSAVKDKLNNVSEIYSTDKAFTALKKDGTVVTWGDATMGGDSSAVESQLTNINHINPVINGFIASRSDGTVVSWGTVPNFKVDVRKIVKLVNRWDNVAYATLNDDGTVTTWGDEWSSDSSAVQRQLTNVTDIFSSEGVGFAALKDDGTVVLWGGWYNESDFSEISDLTNIAEIYGDKYNTAFVALRNDDTVIPWGNWGDDDSLVPDKLTNVTEIYSNSSAYAALKSEGTVVTWGDNNRGGDSSAVQNKLTNVAKIYMIETGFAALRHDGSVVTWGSSETSANYHAPFIDEIRPKSSGINIVKVSPNPTIVLHGSLTKNVLINNAYIELGASVVDDRDNNIDVVISGTVDTSTLGSYTVTYTATDSDDNVVTITRVVNVIAVDNTAPDIVLNGDSAITVLLNEPYLELGAEAIDDIDGDTEVFITGIVDTATLGRYNVTYSATDMANNSNSVSRLIDVVHRAPIINSLDITQSKIEQGYALQALITCTDCITNSHVYTWTIDGNIVANTDNYLLTNDDFNKKLLVEVTVSNESGLTDTAYHLITINSPRYIEHIYSNYSAFAALRNDGTVVTWGDNERGGDSSAVQDKLSDVNEIHSNSFAFAALKNDGTVVTWGDSEAGGNSSHVTKELTDVTIIYSTTYAFAALKNDGTVVTWGNGNYGGDSSAVEHELTEVTTIYSTGSAFAALKNDGTVVTWGDNNSGGDSSHVTNELTGVTEIYASQYAFAALKNNGTVVTWGHSNYGGDSSEVQDELTDIIKMFAFGASFSAIKSNGSVVAWGKGSRGEELFKFSHLTNVIQMYSSENVWNSSFAALKSDGTLETKGVSESSSYSNRYTYNFSLENITEVYSNPWSFAAIKNDGSVVTWGYSDNRVYGASSQFTSGLTNVAKIYSNNDAFAALKNDGTVFIWNWNRYGGTSSGVSDELINVTEIYSNGEAFAALKNDGSVFAWGDSQFGGDIRAVAHELSPHIPLDFIPNAPVVTLNGEQETTLMLGDTYSELGASTLDDVDSDVEVVISGAVDTSIPGTYIVTYRVTDSDNNTSIVTRKVTVLPIDNVAPAISLNGANSIELFANNTYSEPGANAFDDRDGAIDVVISGVVDTTIPGTYTLTYTATDSTHNVSSITRTINIIADITAPIITLNGESEVLVVINKAYTELGATSIDDNDGEVEVVISGIVDTATLGTYTVTYTATDSANNTSSITRKVDIVEPYPPIINDITIVTELTESGHQLRADIDCTECLVDNHQYTWTIDGEVVSTNQSYLLTPDNFHKKIQVEVVVFGDEDLSNSAYKTYLAENVQVIDIYAISDGFAALRNDGTVVTWASCHSVVPDINTIKQIHFIDGVITILTDENTVVIWECIDHGADVKRDLINVAKLVFNGYAFAAIKNDGTVVTWGHSTRGGDSSSVANSLTNVTAILYSSRAFAALKSDGSVVTWGDSEYGGDSSLVTYNLSNVTEIVSNDYAFAALKADGTVVTWGGESQGGDSSSVVSNLANVVEIRSLKAGFSVLKSDGSAIIWGDEYLAHSGTIDLTNVVGIYDNSSTYAALKSDGSVVTFGEGYHSNDITNVAKIYPEFLIMYAIKNDGSIISFNKLPDYDLFRHKPLLVGSNYNDPLLVSAIIRQINSSEPNSTINVVDLTASTENIAKLWSDGSLDVRSTSHAYEFYQSEVNVAKIYSNGRAFATLKNNGVVVTITGNIFYQDNRGGDSSAVADELLPAITLTDVPNAPLLRFNGDKEITLHLNDTYTELGVTAQDDIDETVQVIVSGTVDTATTGVYSINYTATDSDSNEASITRTVNVVLP